jgi:hypothetical protein
LLDEPAQLLDRPAAHGRWHGGPLGLRRRRQTARLDERAGVPEVGLADDVVDVRGIGHGPNIARGIRDATSVQQRGHPLNHVRFLIRGFVDGVFSRPVDALGAPKDVETAVVTTYAQAVRASSDHRPACGDGTTTHSLIGRPMPPGSKSSAPVSRNDVATASGGNLNTMPPLPGIPANALPRTFNVGIPNI